MDELQLRRRIGDQLPRQVVSALIAKKAAYDTAKDAYGYGQYLHNKTRTFVDKVADSIENKLYSTNNSTMPFKTKSTFRKKAKASSKRAPKKRVAFKNKTTLKKQVRSLQQRAKATDGKHTYRLGTSQSLQTTVGVINQGFYSVTDCTNLESSTANLRYYNPSVPGTLTTAAGSTGTYSRDIHFDKVTGKIVAINNYQVPVWVRVYLCKAKQDTNISPTTYYSDGVTDQVISGSATSPMVYPTDIDILNEAYKITMLKNSFLMPGRHLTVSHTVKDINYDPSQYDTHALNYQAKYKAFGFLIRICGPLQHDTGVITEQAYGNAGIDLDFQYTYNITYQAGVNLNDISYSNTRDTAFTNGGVCTNMPVADNQTYSQG